MNRAAGSGGRFLLAAGTETYRHGADFEERLEDLDRVPDALRWVVETFTGLGYQAEPEAADKYLLNPSLQQMREAVRAAAEAAPVVVVYYTGHGLQPEGDSYYLVTTETQPGLLEDTALEARQFLRLVLRKDARGGVLPGDKQPQVLIILDCCFAGAGGLESLRDSLESVGNPRVWWLASASTLEYAQQGRFAQALKQCLLDPDVGSSQQLLGLDWVVDKINEILGQTEQEAGWFPPRGRSTGLTPFFPNPKYVPGVAGLTVAEQHWVSRLRGLPADRAAAGIYITGSAGRFRVVQDLAAWMRVPDRGGLAVVTGIPGSGKSAMLALPVLLTDLQRRATLLAGADPGSLLARAADLFDRLPVFGVHARGMNPYQVAGAIAHNLGRAADSPGELLEDLDDHPDTSSRIVVIDAIDEARDPPRLLTDLLLPLARRPGLRIVIGARRHVVPPAADTSLLIDLGSDDYCDPQALADYAHQLLIAAREPDVHSPYRDRDDDTAVTVAAAIAKKATERPGAAGLEESFLLAQLLARAVRGRQQALDVNRAGWADQLPAGVGEAFDEDLRRLLGKREPAARILLTALAWAKGPGLPWERIWVPVAQALAAHSGTGALRLDRDEIRWLLDNARTYIVEDVGPGQRSVFRPFHDLVAAYLRGQPSSEQAAADPSAEQAWQQRRQQVERDITQVLLDSVPAFPDGTADWELAHPYLCTYLAQHAHAAGPDTFGGVVADLDYLAVADPAIVTPILTPTDPALRRVARQYRRAHPLLGDDPHANAAYLYEAVHALTGTSAPQDGRIRPLYRTRLTSVRRDDSLLTLPGRGGTVDSVAFGSGPDGRLLLASGSGDGTVRVWDPATGAPVGQPLTGHAGEVATLAFGTGPGGRLLLASGSEDATIRLWDPATGAPVGQPLTGHAAYVTSVAFGTGPDGRLLLASCSHDETVRLWDPVTRRAVHEPPWAYGWGMVSVAFGSGPDGRLLLASGSHRGTVQVWDPATGAPLGQPLTGHTADVGSVAFGTAPDGRLLLASGSHDGTVRVWDPATGALVGQPLTGHTGSVHSVAFGTAPDGRLLLASSSNDETVRLWDPITGAPAGQPLTGHTNWVVSVAFGTGPGGQLLLASGSYDGTVRVWDPITATPTSQPPHAVEPFTGHTALVSSVAFGSGPGRRLLLASGSWDGTVRVWDPATGAPAGQPLTGHTGYVHSVAFGTGPGGRLLLASGTFSGLIWLWDPTTDTAIGKPLTGHTGSVKSVAFRTGPDGRLLLASGSSDGTVRVWDPATGTAIGKPLTGHTSWVESVAFGTTSDGRLLLASGSRDETVRLWDPITGAPAGQPLTGHTNRVESVAFGTTSDGRLLLASGSNDGTVRVWDPVTGAPVGQPLTAAGPVSSVALHSSSDGRLMLVSGTGDNMVQLWDLAARICNVTLARRSMVHSVAITAGGMLAIGDDEGISVLEF